MYHLSLFYVGFGFGKAYQYGEIMWDGARHAYEYYWSDLYYPACLLVFFLVALAFIRARDELSAKAFAIFGAVTWVPSVALYAIAYMNDYVNSSVHAYTYWFLLGLFVLASVIFVFDIICAIQTHREDKVLKKKFDTTA